MKEVGRVPDLAGANWRKSSYSGTQSECVEVAPLADAVAVRDSKHPDGAVLRFDRSALAAFLAGVAFRGREYLRPL